MRNWARAARAKNPEKYRATQKRYWENRKERVNAKRIKARIEDRATVIKHYTNGKNRCSCCGESEDKFLSLEHLNGDGAAHRKAVGVSRVWRWLIMNNFPDGYDILCMNCNWGQRMNNGVCPHKEHDSKSNNKTRKKEVTD